MRWPIVTVTSLDSSAPGVDVLKANPVYTIESLPYPRRYYYFSLLIKIGFEFNDNKSLLLTDNNEVNSSCFSGYWILSEPEINVLYV